MNCRDHIMDLAMKEATLSAMILEFGVFTGGTINNIARHFYPRKVFGFDSFEGLPEKWRDGYEKGKFNLNGKLPRVRNNVILIKGLFQDTLQPFLDEHIGAYAQFINIDCDLYSSTKFVLDTLLKNKYIIKDTVLYFDEFEGNTFNDEARAFKESGIKANLIGCFVNKKQNYSSYAFKVI